MASISDFSHLFCLLLVLPLGFVFTKDFKALCTTCRQITHNFDKGLEKTAKLNFGGGNTAWEERKLSKYELSEIRLLEILEGLCESSSFECNHMVEEHEEHFESWWFKRKENHPDLFKWFCIDTLKVCCAKGSFGPDCNTCIGGLERPCYGNGKCDGDGTRDGSGMCSCDKGYEGEFCMDCSDGFYSELRNDSFSVCKECHESCYGCSGGTRKNCKDCRKGWDKDEEGACIDINECSKEPLPCKDDQYCINTEGSFTCQACNTKCSGCKGPGADSCITCADGYVEAEGICTDVNECKKSEAVCIGQNQKCFNTEGSFMCQCTTGFQEQDGMCVKRQEKAEETQHVPAINSEDTQAADSPEKHEDL